MKREILKNQNQISSQMDISPSDGAILINGMYFDMDYTDFYTLMDHIRTEERVMGGLYKLGKCQVCLFQAELMFSFFYFSHDQLLTS